MENNHSTQLALMSYLRHELRTPINAIIGYSEMLLEEIATDPQTATTSHLEQIQNCGNQLLALINKHLDPASVDNYSSLHLATISEAIPLALEPLLKMVISCCDQLSEQAAEELIADINKIRTATQSLFEIINNITHFAERYLQLNNIKFENKVSEENHIERNSYKKSTNRSGNILVVDDNESNRDLLSRLITAQGYTVTTAANGLQAIQLIKTGNYDLILLDILMPEVNGYEVLQWLREQFQHIPAIAISALDEIDSVVKCIEMGAEDYLTKPFNSVLLRARIEACLEKKRLRDREAQYLAELGRANQEITILNERLKAENFRLSAELEVTRKLQQMILPKDHELSQIEGLDIAGYMEPADEVGGDYYDVLHADGRVKIGIGDVTGHGLESGVLMIMVQTAVRTLMENNETDPKKFLEVLNRTIYNNIQRMSSNKNLTLSLADYHNGKLNLSGQHEKIIVIRSNGALECIDTIDLGFPIGLEESIVDFVAQTQIQLQTGDVVVLYTDGITEAENSLGVQYGIDRLCEVVQQNWQKSVREIRQIVIDDLCQHIGQHKVYDDITLVILKQK
ncbi:SpoIIE family protein phosphatase [Chroococcidiopsis sp. TS-821]|uniref:SpoIIE family protein phosphatase n=1 Tax=Chroococcidiopsis sp. TS-821 TaxID=1378066 RepID=UPI000CEF4114|nr:SpoIIE family protein phosphatase [Chroococcidiopsis sp. TS-821]PPS45172.1 response regulator receiver protein [Chroococcidiopsis sp. TS-821]